MCKNARNRCSAVYAAVKNAQEQKPMTNDTPTPAADGLLLAEAMQVIDRAVSQYEGQDPPPIGTVGIWMFLSHWQTLRHSLATPTPACPCGIGEACSVCDRAMLDRLATPTPAADGPVCRHTMKPASECKEHNLHCGAPKCFLQPLATPTPADVRVWIDTDTDALMDRLHAPVQWGYMCLADGGFIHDDAPVEAATRIEALAAEVELTRCLARSIEAELLASAEAAEAAREQAEAALAIAVRCLGHINATCTGGHRREPGDAARTAVLNICNVLGDKRYDEIAEAALKEGASG